MSAPTPSELATRLRAAHDRTWRFTCTQMSDARAFAELLETALLAATALEARPQPTPSPDVAERVYTRAEVLAFAARCGEEGMLSSEQKARQASR